MLYYRYEKEKEPKAEAAQLDRSRRSLSVRRGHEGQKEGCQQKGMPCKGTRVKVGDLVRFKRPATPDGGKIFLVIEIVPGAAGMEFGPDTWIRIADNGPPGLVHRSDFEVISEAS